MSNKKTDPKKCLLLKYSAVVSSGASGAVAPPLFAGFTMQLAENCCPTNPLLSNGTTGFETLTTALDHFIPFSFIP